MLERVWRKGNSYTVGGNVNLEKPIFFSNSFSASSRGYFVHLYFSAIVCISEVVDISLSYLVSSL